MAYPQKLFKNLYWSFAIGAIPNIDDFVAEMENYYQDIAGSVFPWPWNDIAFAYPKINIQYVKYIEDEDEDEDDDFTESYVILTADNKQNFTVKELLYKIHQQIGLNLQDDDNCYFEGLDYSGEPDEDNIPIYFMRTGS